MSRIKDTVDCPNCDKRCSIAHFSEPYPKIELSCYFCGFHTDIKVKFLTMEELNKQRLDMGLAPILELPEQKTF